ncbi:methyl-accepting chemotaxis protein [Neorhizobium galegae]|uniref:methyl-accepting chemotaxis protein n=2 Tax=Neorhizobium galegae TaxID=399 RepID=UPI001ED6BD46|nr:methyl-accepting chemotaxis protein [Neorhizobium galegae]MBP2562307.1 methyl-accepting chemotaxis protein [Neorhizobium galegae]
MKREPPALENMVFVLIANLRTMIKLVASFSLILLVGLTVNLVTVNSSTTQQEATVWTEHTYQVLRAVDGMIAGMVNQETGLRGYLLAGDEKFLDPQKAGEAQFRAAFEQTKSLTSDNALQQKRLTDLEGQVKGWSREVMSKEIALMRDAKTVDQARAMEVSGAGKTYMDSIRAIAKEISDEEASLLDERAAASANAANHTFWSIVVGLAATIIVIAASLLLLSATMIRPIQAITASMKRLASGDAETAIPFAGRVDEIGEMAAAVEVFRTNALENRRLEQEANTQRSQSEEQRRRTAEQERLRAEAMAQATSGLAEGLKQLAAGNLSFELSHSFAQEFESLRADFNQAVGQLKDTMSSVAETTNSIDSGSREISQSADDLSKRTEQQAASLEETAAALDEITANVASSSRRAEEARTVAIQANDSARLSGAVVANAVDAMGKIEQSSNQISSIIGVIDDIAFQTNLLALNAGVEAARAGEAGKGFAVVAQEVRELAQRSATAAKEIKDLIRNSSVQVGNGVHLVRQTGEALKTIEAYIVTINQHMDAIATSSREQSVGLSEVNTAVNQMDQVTQQNAAMVEEANAAGATLATEAGRLRELVSRFHVGAAPSDHAPPRSRPLTTSSESAPVTSPARGMVNKIARAFTGKGSAAVAANNESWEEF